jgi:hypothetical protein
MGAKSQVQLAKTRAAQAGFTLTEVLLMVVISGISIVGLFAILGQSASLFLKQQGGADLLSVLDRTKMSLSTTEQCSKLVNTGQVVQIRGGGTTPPYASLELNLANTLLKAGEVIAADRSVIADIRLNDVRTTTLPDSRRIHSGFLEMVVERTLENQIRYRKTYPLGGIHLTVNASNQAEGCWTTGSQSLAEACVGIGWVWNELDMTCKPQLPNCGKGEIPVFTSGRATGCTPFRRHIASFCSPDQALRVGSDEAGGLDIKCAKPN